MHVRGVARFDQEEIAVTEPRRECFEAWNQAGVFDVRADRRGRAPEHGAEGCEQQADCG